MRKNYKQHKSTKATGITPKIRKKVWERDNHKCVICDCYVVEKFANSHFIKRSQLGLGIEENILTMCERCHTLFDLEDKEVKRKAKLYIQQLYPNFSDEDRRYSKYAKKEI